MSDDRMTNWRDSTMDKARRGVNATSAPAGGSSIDSRRAQTHPHPSVQRAGDPAVLFLALMAVVATLVGTIALGAVSTVTEDASQSLAAADMHQPVALALVVAELARHKALVAPDDISRRQLVSALEDLKSATRGLVGAGEPGRGSELRELEVAIAAYTARASPSTRGQEALYDEKVDEQASEVGAMLTEMVDGHIVAARVDEARASRLLAWLQAGSFVTLGAIAAMSFAATAMARIGRRELQGVNEALEAQQQELAVHAVVVESTDEAIVVLSGDGLVLSWNDGATRLYGYTRREMVGQPITTILSGAQEGVYEDLPNMLDGNEHLRLESLAVRKDGAELLTSVTLSAVRGETADLSAVVAIARGITEDRRLRDRERSHSTELAHLAFHDPLTGLANRALLNDRMRHALSARDAKTVDVVLLDLDDFKSVNDVLGHAAGDQLLIEVANRLRDCARPEDTVARLGGDEFAILAGENGTAIAERILASLAKPISLGDRLIHQVASVGIADSRDGVDAETLMLRADAAMYAAKAAGKGRSARFDPSMAEGVRKRAELHTALQHAVSQDEIVMHYQPTVDVGSQSVLHVEALVRWHRPTGIVSPSEFLPVAEQSNLIEEIGREALRQSCQQLHDWLVADRRRSLAVNASGRELVAAGFAEAFSHTLVEHDVLPTQVVLEVTETLFLDVGGAGIDCLTALRALGVRIAIDDFGTGYSSLGRLQQLPVDSLKIDKSFIDLIQTGLEDVPIVTSMILMSHSLGLEVTAEGVETRQQAERLIALGCDRLQGFYFARPEPAASALTSAAQRAERAFTALLSDDGQAPVILIIEDDPVSRMVARSALTSQGFIVEEASTGANGLLLARRLRPACILVDLGLPDIDGLALVAALRDEADLRRTAIVVVTGTAQREVKAAAFATCVDDYIVKPIIPQHLVVRLRAAIRNASAPPATSVR